VSQLHCRSIFTHTKTRSNRLRKSRFIIPASPSSTGPKASRIYLCVTNGILTSSGFQCGSGMTVSVHVIPSQAFTLRSRCRHLIKREQRFIEIRTMLISRQPAICVQTITKRGRRSYHYNIRPTVVSRKLVNLIHNSSPRLLFIRFVVSASTS
jgi:hypothetical protein